MLSIAPTLNAFAGPLNQPAPRAAVKMAVEAPITVGAGDYGFEAARPRHGGGAHASVTPARSPRCSSPLLSRSTAGDVRGDSRGGELKHGRLAMLAAVAWPLQIRSSAARSSSTPPLVGFGVRDALMETARRARRSSTAGMASSTGRSRSALARDRCSRRRAVSKSRRAGARVRTWASSRWTQYSARRLPTGSFDPLNRGLVAGGGPVRQLEEKVRSTAASR